MQRRRSRRRGATLTEVALAASASVLVLTGSISTFLMSTKTWLQGESVIDAGNNANQAIRIISKEMREAMAVTVDANGLGLSYRRPSKDSGGNYIMPITWDGVSRRIEMNGTDLQITGGTNRTICKNIQLTDPSSPGGTTPYTIFSAGPGSITRSLTIMLVTKRAGLNGKFNTSRIRETIFLRNIPELTK